VSLSLLLAQAVASGAPRARQARLNELRNRMGVRAGAPLDPTPYLRRLRWVKQLYGLPVAMMTHKLLVSSPSPFGDNFRFPSTEVDGTEEDTSIGSIFEIPYPDELCPIPRDAKEVDAHVVMMFYDKKINQTLFRSPVGLGAERARWIPWIASCLAQDDLRVKGAARELREARSFVPSKKNLVGPPTLLRPRWCKEGVARVTKWGASIDTVKGLATRIYTLESVKSHFEGELRSIRVPALFDWLVHARPEAHGLTLEDAIAQARAWHRELAQRSREDIHAEMIAARPLVHRWEDGWALYRLLTPEQLKYEGDALGHCIGGYANQLGNDNWAYYSLHDPNGHPRVSMELEMKDGRTYRLSQVYGKANSIPSGERAIPAARALVWLGFDKDVHTNLIDRHVDLDDDQFEILITEIMDLSPSFISTAKTLRSARDRR
jgi:hypothetical protein